MMIRQSRKIRSVSGVVAVVALAAGLAAAFGPGAAGATGAAGTPAVVTVDPGQVHQAVDGFGFSEAFREPVISSLPRAEIQRIGADLFSAKDGAGMSIVRFGLGGATDPGDPVNGPGDYSDQLWLGHLAEEYGVRQFYADAWSAPARDKTNDSLDNGGYLCGSPGESCASGDARAAYAAYLAGQAAGFARNGIPLEAVDFVNEPEIGPDYASMEMTPGQAANFVPYLGRALEAARLPTRVACCDAEGWLNSAGFDGAQAYTSAVLGDPAAARYVNLVTGHGYTSPPSVPLTSRRHAWESEWADFGTWDPAWDDGTSGDGFTWASDIQDALVRGDVSAFCYWWGASNSTANSDLIRVQGPSVSLSKRYWAFAAFGRFIRPGAVRLGVSTDNSNLRVSAFRDADGSEVTEILNAGTTDQPVTLRGLGGGGGTGGSPGGESAYVTNSSDSLTPVSGPLTVPARSLLTVVTGGE
ncbi:MAG: glycoside hydrolase family 30 protein [Nocardiopsaceae bacterium]|nr:glycoside hydrolase family 30 protein [Nocardiopsaceae bacterium]